MPDKYILISVEVWEVHEEHQILARRETEVQIPRRFKLSDLTDTAQRASANMIELLKDYLTYNKD